MTLSLANFLRCLPLALFNDIKAGNIILRAMALVYATLLSFVPLLALSFSVLKSFGVHKQLESLLLQMLAPLGSVSQDFAQQVLGFVDNVQVTVLGAAGLLTLLYTVMMLMRRVEEAFNYVWGVKQSRRFLHQVRNYLSMVFVGPVVLFSLIGLWRSLLNTTWAQNVQAIEPLGTWISMLLNYVPTLLVILLFILLYLIMPNTRVRLRAAALGGVAAGLMWLVAAWVFGSFIAGSGEKQAIYSIFAGMFLFMIWLYMAWMISLIGARLAYYCQYPGSILLAAKPEQTSPQAQEMLAMTLLSPIIQSFLQGGPLLSLNDLHAAIPLPRVLLQDTLDTLVQLRILTPNQQTPPRYVLCTAPESLTPERMRRYFWEGTEKQQQQVANIQAATGFKAVDARNLRQWVEQA